MPWQAGHAALLSRAPIHRKRTSGSLFAYVPIQHTGLKHHMGRLREGQGPGKGCKLWPDTPAGLVGRTACQVSQAPRSQACWASTQDGGETGWVWDTMGGGSAEPGAGTLAPPPLSLAFAHEMGMDGKGGMRGWRWGMGCHWP